jgi:hypothetical protein
MFSVTSAAVLAGQGRLRALRLSLNTPVVAIDALPVGPASAGIAVHEGPRGHALCLAIRSVRSGQLALFAPEDANGAGEAPFLRIDAALSFAEGMGFLFDDDLVARGEAREGAERWALLTAGAAPAGPETSADGGEAPAPFLSKFRLRPLRVPAREAAGVARDEVWLRLLSRF